MMKQCSIRVLVGIFFCTSTYLTGTVNFGSRDSAIKISTGGVFNIGSSNLTIDGTLQTDGSASAIQGNVIAFNGGMLDSAGLEAVMQGNYDPAGEDTISLQGSGKFRAEPGTVLHGFSVSGTGNLLEGQPSFSSAIQLADSETELAIDIQNKLNKNIVMNGGTIILDDDLRLVDNVKLTGSGRVEFNGRQLRLGGYYATPWSNSLYFNNAADLVLDGNTDLTGTWTFGGISCLNGNGCTLDLKNVGQIIVDNGGKLYLNDVNVVGLGDTKGKIIMRNNDSQIKISNTSFKLNDDFTTNRGTLYAFGPTTFMLGQKNWNFNNDASGGIGNLTVDGTSLLLDYLDSPANLGNVNAPLPLFDGTVWNGQNLLTDLASGNLSLINRGTIKQTVDLSILGLSAVEVALLSGGPISGTFNLNEPVILGPNDRLTIGGDTTINGRGGKINFNNVTFPQCTIHAGKKLVLSNVTLTGINQNTFDIRTNGILQIGDNVIWELDQNLTLSSNGLVQVTNGNTGGNVFTVRGNTCRRKFTINPLIQQNASGKNNINFNLGHNTLLLENAEFEGLSHVQFTSDSNFASAIAMSGNSGVDIGDDTAINFFVEGINNDIILRNDGLTLSGNIAFGNLATNALNVRFAVASLLDAADPIRQGVTSNYPVVNFSGDPGIFLFSQDGIAQLNFFDLEVAIRNSNSNAFIADDNGLLSFGILEVLDNPVMQSSSRFRTSGLALFGLGIDAGAVRSFRFDRSKSVRINALMVKRERDKEALLHAQKTASKHAKTTVPKVGKAIKSSRKTTPKKARRDVEGFDGQLLRSLNLPGITDSNSVPVFDQTYAANTILDLKNNDGTLTPLNGNRQFASRSVLNNFNTSSQQPFNILLDNGVTVVQAADNCTIGTDGTNTQFINIRGKNNVIQVTRGMIIKSDSLRFDEGAELIFEFVNDGSTTPIVIFEDTANPSFAKNCILQFRGKDHAVGQVMLNSIHWSLPGTKRVLPRTDTEEVANYSTIKIADSASLSVFNAKIAQLSGIFKLEVVNGGKIDLSDGGSLIFGADSPVSSGYYYYENTGAGSGERHIITAADTALIAEKGAVAFDEAESEWVNHIECVVNSGGAILVGTNSFVAQSNLSFRHCSLDFKVELGGLLYVGNNGTCAFNAGYDTNNPANLVTKPGRIKRFWIGKLGALVLDQRGKLLFGSNKKHLNPPVEGATGLPFPFIFESLAANILGTGTVQFVPDAGEDALQGALAQGMGTVSSLNNQTALGLVNALIVGQ